MTRKLRIRLAGAVIGTALVALTALILLGSTRNGGTIGAAPHSGLTVPARVTPTATVPANDTASIAAGKARLLASNPTWASLIGAVSAGNVDEVVRYLDFRIHECTANSARDGDASRCEELQLPDGTSVPMFPEDGRGAVPLDKSQEAGLWFRSDKQMRELLTAALAGRNARLDLIASLGAPELVISFAIDPVVLRPGGPQVASISFRADDPSVSRLQAFALGVASTTPFEALRGQERAGQVVDYWGISDELRSRDAAIHSERYDSSAVKATPGP